MTLEHDRGLRLRRPYGREHVAILSGDQASAFDRRSIDELGVPSALLIESAGRAAAALIHKVGPDGSLVVLAGKGNNGADAIVAARTLHSWGRLTHLIPLAEDFDASLLHGWDVPLLRLEDAEVAVRSADVVVDGILGTGLRGSPRDRAAQAIQIVAHASGMIVAMDIPSGVDANSGAIFDPVVRADLTIGFGSAKLGAVLHPGREQAGRLIVVDIGFPPLSEPPCQFITPAWANKRTPRRTSDAHKNSVGAVCVVAGREGMAGAAVLATRAALRAGAGYVRVATDGSNRDIVQTAVPEAVFINRDDPDALRAAIVESRAVLVGPGMGVDASGAATLEGVLAALNERGDAKRSTPAVLDADALTLLGQDWLQQTDASRQIELPPQCLLTPHLGEMARLTGRPRDDLQADLLAAARQLAEERNVSVLLKGAPTTVTAPHGRTWVAASQTSDLAVAGMGDTLSGTIASFVAQGLPPVEAAAVALEVTARAGSLAVRGAGLTPSDVIEHLAEALGEQGAGHTDLLSPFVLFDQDAPR